MGGYLKRRIIQFSMHGRQNVNENNMSDIQVRLAGLIIRDHFGENVEKIIINLLHKGRRNLRDIVQDINMERNMVKQCLSIGIKHKLISFEENKKMPTTYKADVNVILLRSRFSKFVYNAKILYGDAAELIVETMLMDGAEILSKVVSKVAERLLSDNEQAGKKPDTNLVYQKCVELIKGRFLKRLALPCDSNESSEDEEKRQIVTETEAYSVPPGILLSIGSKRKETNDAADEPPSKKHKSESSENESMGNEKYPDDGIYWHVNFERFHQHMFDQLLQSAIAEKIDQSAGSVIRTMLRESEMGRNLSTDSTKSFPVYEIARKLPALPVMTQQELSQYLQLLSDKKRGGFVTKTDDSGGGTFCVDLKKSVDILCQYTIETVVQERLGSKACRIFRLLLMKKNLEQKQIEELAMIPFKETKELLYKMFQEKLVCLQELSKNNDYAPSRTFYLFSVDLPQVARLLLNRSYQAIANLIVKRESLMAENKRLLEKNERIERILSAIGQNEENQDAILEELDELIAPAEKEQLKKLKIDFARLEHGELQVDETMQILSQYLIFH